MKGKFLKVSSLFVATLTTATLVSSPAAKRVIIKSYGQSSTTNAVKQTANT